MSEQDPYEELNKDETTEQKASREKLHLEAKISQDQEDEDLKWLMKSRSGRRIIWRILERAGIYRSSFNPDAMAMAFAEGQKNEGLRTLARIHTVCPTLYSPMVKENGR